MSRCLVKHLTPCFLLFRESSRTCRWHRWNEKCDQNLIVKTKGEKSYGRLGHKWRMIFKCDVWKYSERFWAGLIWFGIVTSRGVLWTRQWTFLFRIKGAISWLGKYNVRFSQEIWSMDLQLGVWAGRLINSLREIQPVNEMFLQTELNFTEIVLYSCLLLFSPFSWQHIRGYLAEICLLSLSASKRRVVFIRCCCVLQHVHLSKWKRN